MNKHVTCEYKLDITRLDFKSHFLRKYLKPLTHLKSPSEVKGFGYSTDTSVCFRARSL